MFFPVDLVILLALLRYIEGMSTLYIVSNESFSCSANLSGTTYSNAARSQLDNQGILALSQLHRMKFSRHYQANSKDEAYREFYNLLPLDKATVLAIKAATNSSMEDVLMKQEVIEYLKTANHKTIPLMNLVDIVATRDAEATPTLQTDYCIPRGSLTSDQSHLSMCTVCALTRDFGENFWPRYVNEAICTTEDPNCIFVNGQAQGSCFPITLPLEVLWKQDNSCIVVQENGEILLVEEWIPTTKLIQVGCQCAVASDSYAARFV